jgi:hypothetical protein
VLLKLEILGAAAPTPFLFCCPLADDTLLLGLPVDKTTIESADLVISEDPFLVRFGLDDDAGSADSAGAVENIGWGDVATFPSCTDGVGPPWIDNKQNATAWKNGALTAKRTLRAPLQLTLHLAEHVRTTGGTDAGTP